MRILVAFLALATTSLHAQRPTPPAIPSHTDEYIRYELLAPATGTYRVTLDTSVIGKDAREYVDGLPRGASVASASAVDLMTGTSLPTRKTATGVVVSLARPVPANGQGRIRLDTVLTNPAVYSHAGDAIAFRQTLDSRRAAVVLPAGFELVSCNLPSQVLSELDGRVTISFMNQAPGRTDLVVEGRAGAAVGPAAAPVPLSNRRNWEPPPSQGPTERARLAERARQDRDITYFLRDPSTHAFSLFHDYTESREGIDNYVNVVRTGSRVSDPSAYILDTGEPLRQETLKGTAITDARIDIGEPVTPETEVVVIRFPPVKAGQSVRLRISETYTAPVSYRLEGEDLVFERSFGRPRNSVVLPAGWYLTAASIPAVISRTPEGLVRLDFMNGRPDSIDVLIKARRRPGP